MARSKPLLRIGADVAEARKGLADIAKDAKDIDRIKAEARVKVQTDAAKIKLEQLNARLENFGKQEQTAKVTLASAKVIDQIDRIEAGLGRLNGRNVEVNVKINEDVKRDRLSNPLGALGGVGGIAGGAVKGVGSIAAVAGNAAGSLATLIPALSAGTAGFIALGGAAAIALPLLAALAGAVVLLGGVLAALLASLAGAVAGAAILGTALGAALLGPLVIVIAAVAKLVSIFQAFSAQEKASVSSAASLQAAQQQSAQAAQGLADANANLAVQTKAARLAQQDATEAVKDDLLARQQAALGVDQARLNSKKAQQALSNFRTGSGDPATATFQKFTDVNVDQSGLGSALAKARKAGKLTKDDSLELQQLILDVRSAKLSERQANDALSDSARKLSRDRATEADFLKNGLSAYPGYIAALRQVRSAQAGIATASLAVVSANAAQSKGLEDLNPKERALARSLRSIKTSLEAAFSPAIDSALAGIVRALRIFSRVANDPKIQDALKGIGKALNRAFVGVALALSSPGAREALVKFLESGGRLIRPLTRLFTALGKTVADLTQNALPFLEKKFDKFARALTRFTKGGKTQTIKFGVADFKIPDMRTGAQRLKGTVDGLIRSFENFVDIGRGLSRIILAFFRAGRKTGDQFTESLGEALLKYGDFLNSRKGQAQLKSFFATLRNIVRDIARALDSIVDKLGKVPKLVKIAKDSAGGGASGLGGATAGIVKGIVELFGPGKAKGGFVQGPSQPLDSILTPLTGGEYVIRKNVVDSIGLPFLDALNAGKRPAIAGGGGGRGGTHIENLNMYTAPGRDMDPRTAAVLLTRELGRRP